MDSLESSGIGRNFEELLRSVSELGDRLTGLADVLAALEIELLREMVDNFV